MIVGMAFGLASRADLMDGTVLGLLDIGWKFMQAGASRRHDLGGGHRAGQAPTSKPDRGVVTLQIEVLNQHGEVAQTGTAKALVRRKDASGG